jgi:hypothetical protein
VEDLGTSLQNTEDNESNSETTSDVVIFDPDAEPDTLDDYEYDFKNPLHFSIVSHRNVLYYRFATHCTREGHIE